MALAVESGDTGAGSVEDGTGETVEVIRASDSEITEVGATKVMGVEAETTSEAADGEAKAEDRDKEVAVGVVDSKKGLKCRQ